MRAVSYESDSESSIEAIPSVKGEGDQLFNSINGKLEIATTAHDTNEVANPEVKKARHARSRSAVSPLFVDKGEQEASQSKELPSPESTVIATKSKFKLTCNDEDDNVSIPDSTVGTGRVRRNEAERIQYFENQTECGKMEPHQVQCLRCDKLVNLGRRQTYAVRPWEVHRISCDQRPAYKSLCTPNGKEGLKTASLSPQAIVSQPTPARRPSEQERKDFLVSDIHIETVEKHRVYCRKCRTWVDLGLASSYATGNWVKHKVRCSAVIPSSRVAAAKGRLVLVNDSQVSSFDSRNVECSLCGGNIVLDGEGDFNLTKWSEHKSSCIKAIPVSKSDAHNSIPFPAHSPPLSSVVTEDTAIVGAGVSGERHSLKRPREDTDGAPLGNIPKAVRPRTQSYVPPTMEPPDSVLGWFMLPIHSFIRGFKESLVERS